MLKNLTAAAVSRLLPRAAAAAVVYFIAVAFCFNLLVNFVLKARPACTGWLQLPRRRMHGALAAADRGVHAGPLLAGVGGAGEPG